MGKGSTRIGRRVWGLQFSDVPALGGDGSGGCGLYRGNGGCGDKYRGIGSHYFSFKEKIKRLMKFFSLIPVIAIGGLLIWAAQDFPQWGDDESPASKSPVSSHFIGNTGVDTEVPNMVTAVLADYRGFDTMFETVVVFIAGLAVIAILQGSTKGRRRRKDHEVEAEPDIIVTNMVRLVIPILQIFAFYVLAHGHVSRWRIQGGVVMGGELYSYRNIVGFGKSHVPVSDQDVFDRSCFRILLYGGIGLLSMFLGGEFLDYAELEECCRFPGRWHAIMRCSV